MQIITASSYESSEIGRQYDKIATWWNEYHIDSDYGVAQVEKAMAMSSLSGKALDVGCGSGGRFIRRLRESGFNVTGLDASANMIKLAQTNHPDCRFFVANIQSWDTDETFDFILAWDCLFHLPLDMQEPVLSKLCHMLAQGGTMIYTFGDAIGTHTDKWRGQDFHYSSIGIAQNINILRDNDLSLRHLELDQFPESHVYAIARRL